MKDETKIFTLAGIAAIVAIINFKEKGAYAFIRRKFGEKFSESDAVNAAAAAKDPAEKSLKGPNNPGKKSNMNQGQNDSYRTVKGGLGVALGGALAAGMIAVGKIRRSNVKEEGGSEEGGSEEMTDF